MFLNQQITDICKKKATSVYSTNSNKKTIFPLKNFQTPPTVILCLSSLFQIQFPKWNPDIFWTPATFTFSHSPSSLSNLIPEIKHYSLSYPNSLPSTIASSIFSLPQCSSPTYGVSSLFSPYPSPSHSRFLFFFFFFFLNIIIFWKYFIFGLIYANPLFLFLDCVRK